MNLNFRPSIFAWFKLSRSAKSLLGALVFASVSMAAAQAQDTWTNGGATASWDTPSNWSAGTIPTSTTVAVFDTAGAGTVTNGSADTASQIQFGQTSESSVPTAASFNLSSGTIDIADATGSTIVSYLGSANTATQTISSALVLGTSSDTGAKLFTINDASAGNLVLSGNISSASSTPTTESLELTILDNVGSTVTLSGTNTIYDPASGAGTSLGSVVTGAYGNLSITNAAALGAGSTNSRESVYGNSGTLQFATGTGTGIVAGQTAFINFFSARTSESAPQLENVSGTNTIGEIVEREAGNSYIQSDSGLLTIATIQQDGSSTSTDITYLDGSGNGIITSQINDKTAAFVQNVVKDGSGMWTIASTASQVAAIPVTVQGGTFLVNTTSVTGFQAPVTVNNSGTGNSVLGGTGTIDATVTLTAGSLTPGSGSGTGTTLNVTAATSITTANLTFNLNSNSSTVDKLAANGGLTLSSATLVLNDLGSTVLTAGTTLTLASYSSLAGTFSNVANGGDITAGANTYMIDYTDGASAGTITAIVQAVPEPQTWALLLGGLSVLALLNFKRKSLRLI
jgi:hypothetical protein